LGGWEEGGRGGTGEEAGAGGEGGAGADGDGPGQEGGREELESWRHGGGVGLQWVGLFLSSSLVDIECLVSRPKSIAEERWPGIFFENTLFRPLGKSLSLTS
jgi:hypothetical protein